MDGSVNDAPVTTEAATDSTLPASPMTDSGVPPPDAPSTDTNADDAAIADAPMDAGSDASPYTALILSDTPSAYWPLDEVAGSNVAVDLVGNRTASAQKGSVTFGVAGVNRTAARFANGSQLNAGLYFDLLGQDPFAIEFWVKADANDAGYQNFIDKRGNISSDGYIIYGDTGPIIQFEEAWINDANQGRDCWGSVDFAASFVHVVVTLDSTAGLHEYLNGVEVVAEFSTPGGPKANAVDLTFGPSLTGEMDEIALYNHTLSALQVNAHFHAGHP